MSGHPLFAEQVAVQRDALRDRLAALDYITEVNARAERDVANVRARERGGMHLDPSDPTHVVLPVVWLRALLASERDTGYASLAESPELRELRNVADLVRHDGTAWARVIDAHAELASALAEFLDIL